MRSGMINKQHHVAKQEYGSKNTTHFSKLTDQSHAHSLFNFSNGQFKEQSSFILILSNESSWNKLIKNNTEHI